MSFAVHTVRNLQDFQLRFPSDERCYEYLFKLRCRTRFTCPRPGCGCRTSREMERVLPNNVERDFRVCTACGFQESATAGTIFHGSRITLKDWFQVLWWAAAEEGLNAAKLGKGSPRAMKVRFGSAATPYRCVEIIRRIMAQVPPLKESVFLGLTRVGPTGDESPGKLKLVGLALSERYQEARVSWLPDDSQSAIDAFLAEHVEPGAKIITSGWDGFSHMSDLGYQRETATIIAGGSEPEFQADFRLVGLASRLQQWLSDVGWQIIDRRNFFGYLVEFSFRYACSRKGGNAGFRFTKLLRQALEIAH
jgi:ISXO2-like transposase domain